MLPINRYLLISLLPALLVASSNRLVPPAGVVEREIESEYETIEIDPEKQIPLLEIEIPEEQLDLGGETAFIDSVEFSGNEMLSNKELQRVVKKYMHRELSMQEIHEMCQAIHKKYASKGYFLTRAYVPPQEIKEKTLKIEILEGKLGAIKVIGNKYYGENYIARHFAKYQGNPINYDQILRALLLLDENSDLDVGAVFKKGEEFGTADLIVRVKDSRPIHLMIDHNNYGSDHTSVHRTGARLNYGNLITYGDMVTLAEVLGSPIPSLDFTHLTYHLPVYTYGSSFDFSYLYAHFKTHKDDHVRYTGRSQIATAKFNQAVHRTRRLNTDVFTSFDFKQIQNFGKGKEGSIKSHEVSYDKLRILTGGLLLDYIDGWKGRNLFNLSAGWGIPSFLGGTPIHSHQDSRKHGGGRFVKTNGGWKRLQKIPWDCFLLLNFQMQYSFDKLPLPEQVYIGGPDTVRGYQLAAGIGDHGYYSNIELRVPPPFLRARKIPWTDTTWAEFMQFVGFIDYGRTFSFGQNILRELGINHGKVTKMQNFNSALLTSAGAGVRVHGPWKIELSLDVGYPLTDKHRSSDTIVYFRVAWNIL
jgi:hemolysin activation/secretion protein